MRLLVVDDDPAIRAFLVRGLAEEGFAVDQASDGEEARFKADDPAYDCILLDLTLPSRDGLAVLRELRSRGVATPIIVLTARDAVADRVRGLEEGADDYVVKPFAFAELLARLRAVSRRRTSDYSPLRLADVSLDRRTRVMLGSRGRAELSVRELAILELLVQHAGQVVSRSRIYEYVWNEHSELLSNVIDVHVRQIRRKLSEISPNAAGLVETVRGAGYRVRAGEP